MYVAVSNLGAGGTKQVSLSDTANAVLYAMFAITGLVGGSVNNREFQRPLARASSAERVSSARSTVDIIPWYPGLRTLYWGSLVVRGTYSQPVHLVDVQICSLQTQGTHWFLILASTLLGISAGLLWSAQGALMMSYPLEKDKGKAFSLFWAIFQFGSFIGAVIALSLNIKRGGLGAVSTSTYIVSVLTMSSPTFD